MIGKRCPGFWLEKAKSRLSRFGVWIHAYVLMGNHYHLQLEIPQANSKSSHARFERRLKSGM
jgi:REP element-mobilizing transposase RayT